MTLFPRRLIFSWCHNILSGSGHKMDIRLKVNQQYYTFFYRQLDFPSEPEVANEILENEPKGCLTVA